MKLDTEIIYEIVKLCEEYVSPEQTLTFDDCISLLTELNKGANPIEQAVQADAKIGACQKPCKNCGATGPHGWTCFEE